MAGASCFFLVTHPAANTISNVNESVTSPRGVSLVYGGLATVALAAGAVALVCVATGGPSYLVLAGALGLPLCLLAGIAFGFHWAWLEHRGRMLDLRTQLGDAEFVNRLVPPGVWKLWPCLAWTIAALPVAVILLAAVSELPARHPWIAGISIAALSLGLVVCAWGAVSRFVDWWLVRRACAQLLLSK